ncbi:MAG TPA: hypothetical protein VIY08_15210 [Candidatus Nitrosocosmicus sp.]
MPHIIMQDNMQEIYKNNNHTEIGSTSDLSYFIGKETSERSKFPDKSFMVSLSISNRVTINYKKVFR